MLLDKVDVLADIRGRDGRCSQDQYSWRTPYYTNHRWFGQASMVEKHTIRQMQMADFQPPTAFVFGCGYLGKRVAIRLVEQGWQVSALTRSRQRAAALGQLGIQPVLGDWTNRRFIDAIPPAERVLVAVGFDSRGGKSRHEVYVEGLRNALRAVPATSDCVYVSTTGVYHQGDDQWVDETSPAKPSREGGQAHLRAEELLWRQRASSSGRTVVLRMAGLYGPERVPRLQAVRQGTPLDVQGDSYLNLVHIDDAASCVLAAWQQPRVERLYAIADGTPVLRRDYYQELARLAGAPPAQLAESRRPLAIAGTAGERGRAEGSKRIWTRRMRRDLLPQPQYPSFREGLAAVCQPVK
ncbi:SDR family oxidoreductase [Planctomycetaceae bacterium SH139]